MSLFERIINKNKKLYSKTLQERSREEFQKHIESRARLFAYLDGEIFELDENELRSLTHVEHCSGEHLVRGKIKRVLGDTKEWHDYVNKHKAYHDSIHAMVEQHKVGNIMACRTLRKHRFKFALEDMLEAVDDLLALIELTEYESYETIIAEKRAFSKAIKSNRPVPLQVDFLGNMLIKHAKERDILKKYIRGEAVDSEDLNRLIHHNSCALGNWLNDEGRKRYGNFKEFAQFEKTHHTYHLLINDILQKFDDKNSDTKVLKELAIVDLPKIVNTLKRDGIALFYHIKDVKKKEHKELQKRTKK